MKTDLFQSCIENRFIYYLSAALSEEPEIVYFYFYWNRLDLQCCVSFSVQQSDSIIHLYYFLHSLLLFCYKILSMVPCVIQKDLVDYLICCCLFAKSCLSLYHPVNCSTPRIKPTLSKLILDHSLPVVAVSVQLLSHVRLCNSRTAARQVSLSITNSRSSLKHMSIESVMPSNHSSSVVPFFF